MSVPRVEALRAWEGALSRMTGPRPWGGSYPNDPVVERAYRQITQVTRFPHLIVLPSPGSRVTSATQERYDDHFEAVIVGYVKKTEDYPAADLAEYLRWDCKATLLAAPRPPAVIAVAMEGFGDEDIEHYDNGHAEFYLPFTALLQDALGQ